MAMLRSFGCSRLTTRSPIATSPEVTGSSPAIMRSKVDLPHPEGPSRTTNSPSAMARSSPSITLTLPYALLTSLTVTEAIVRPSPCRPPGVSRAMRPSSAADPRASAVFLEKRLEQAGIGRQIEERPAAADLARAADRVAPDLARQAEILAGERTAGGPERLRHLGNRDRLGADLRAQVRPDLRQPAVERRGSIGVERRLAQLRQAELGQRRPIAAAHGSFVDDGRAHG